MGLGAKTAIGRLALGNAPGVNGDDTIAMKCPYLYGVFKRTSIVKSGHKGKNNNVK